MGTDIEQIRHWYESGRRTPWVDENFCHNRSEFNGRLLGYEKVLASVFSEECLFLTVSSIGEIGNNSFDHNLGFWQGSPGCLFVRKKNYCIVADRGRGIKSSLSNVYQLSLNEEQYIDVAFEKVITGRAPEKRGNGLKFTKKNIFKCNLYLYCVSDYEEIELGRHTSDLLDPIKFPRMNNPGTFTLITWRNHEN